MKCFSLTTYKVIEFIFLSFLPFSGFHGHMNSGTLYNRCSDLFVFPIFSCFFLVGLGANMTPLLSRYDHVSRPDHKKLARKNFSWFHGLTFTCMFFYCNFIAICDELLNIHIYLLLLETICIYKFLNSAAVSSFFKHTNCFTLFVFLF